jgi:hypothetical protein
MADRFVRIPAIARMCAEGNSWHKTEFAMIPNFLTISGIIRHCRGWCSVRGWI